MKIVHVISALTKGGGERMVVELANMGADKGHEVTIIAAWPVDPVYLQSSISEKVNIKFVGKTRKRAFVKIIPWIIKNKKWLCNHDVLHCHLTYGSVFGSAAYILLKKLSRKKRPIIVETNHAVGMPVPRFNRWVHSRMLLLRNGVILMAKDPYWNNFILKHPRLKVQIISNGIHVLAPNKHPSLKKDIQKKLGIPDCRYVVGTISMLRPDRRPSLYIPIFKMIYDAFGKDVHFVIGGEGTEFEKLKSLVKEYELTEQVHIPGLINNPVLTISGMDVYVSISVGETTGVSMIEAAMCKVPVVGIQLLENYQPKEDDWVWSSTDLNMVAAKIMFLLQNNEEREKQAETQSNYVNSHFTAEQMFASYETFYNVLFK